MPISRCSWIRIRCVLFESMRGNDESSEDIGERPTILIEISGFGAVTQRVVQRFTVTATTTTTRTKTTASTTTDVSRIRTSRSYHPAKNEFRVPDHPERKQRRRGAERITLVLRLRSSNKLNHVNTSTQRQNERDEVTRASLGLKLWGLV